MRPTSTWRLAVAGALALGAQAALGQMMPNPYGEAIGVEAARKVATAAIAEARKNAWNVATAVVDTHGSLVYFERMDGTQYGSTHVAQEKARASAQFKRPTKAFEDAVKGGQGPAVLGLPGAVPLEGGVPILVGGKIIGAVGVSGGTSPQDGQCARAGAEALGGATATAQPAATAPPPRR